MGFLLATTDDALRPVVCLFQVSPGDADTTCEAHGKFCQAKRAMLLSTWLRFGRGDLRASLEFFRFFGRRRRNHEEMKERRRTKGGGCGGAVCHCAREDRTTESTEDTERRVNDGLLDLIFDAGSIFGVVRVATIPATIRDGVFSENTAYNRGRVVLV